MKYTEINAKKRSRTSRATKREKTKAFRVENEAKNYAAYKS